MTTKSVSILINARDNASGTIKKIGKSVAAAFTARAAWQGLNKIADIGDDIGKQAKRIGVTTEAWQKLSFAARRTGSDQAEMETGLRRMASTIFDAEKGVKASVDALNDLGLTYNDLKGKRPDEQFAVLGEALNKVSDATTKSALAQDIFGRAGTKLIPMLSEYRDLAQELQAKGGIITDENVKAAEQFKDTMEDLKTTAVAFVSNSGLLQFMNDLATAAGNVAHNLKDVARAIDPSGEWLNIKTLIPLLGDLEMLNKAVGGKTGGGDFNGNYAALFLGKETTKPKEDTPGLDISVLGDALDIFNNEVKQSDVLRDRWMENMTVTPEDLKGPQIVIGDEFEQGFASSLSDLFDTLSAEQSKRLGPTALQKNDPAQANVFRFLSGLGTSVKPAEQTAKNTNEIAQTGQQMVSLLGGLVEINKKMLQNPLTVLPL